MMTTQAAMVHDHVRTMASASGGKRRACSCCVDYTHGQARKARRTQRRREAQAWRAELARGDV